MSHFIFITSSRWTLAFIFLAILCVRVYPAQPASVIYNHLERIKNDTKLLHELRAPSWVESPNMRGTNNILYSCLLTLFACVYTALHLNIPRRTNVLYLFFTKLKWMVLTLFAPELVLWVASDQFSKAKDISKHLQSSEETTYGSIRRHETSYFLNMLRGWATSPWQPKWNDNEYYVGQGETVFDLRHGFFAVMGGLEITDKHGAPKVLSPSGVKWVADKDVALLRIPRSSIQDRSKADTVQKAVVLFQVGWMALQCVARRLYGLPLSLLELHTMVHVACAIMMYAFWFEKPLDIRCAERITLPQPYLDELDRSYYYDSHGNLPDFDADWFYKLRGQAIVDYLIRRPSLILATLVLPLFYGGVHLTAWTFEFPTPSEAIMWKASCVIIASAVPAVYLIVLGAAVVPVTVWDRSPFTGKVVGFCLVFLIYVLLICAVVSRIFIVFESFFSLRCVPIGVYWTPSWIQTIPHI